MSNGSFCSLLHIAVHNPVCSLGHHSGINLPVSGLWRTQQKRSFHALFRLEKDFIAAKYFLFIITFQNKKLDLEPALRVTIQAGIC